MVYVYVISAIIIISIFIAVELLEKRLLAFFLKGLASFSFIALFGALFLERFIDLPFSQIFQILLVFDLLPGIVYILLGLIAGLIGDLVLALRHLRPKTEDKAIIIAGIIAFSVGHIFYYGALLVFSTFSWLGILISVIAAMGVYVMSLKMKFNMGIAKWPVMLYALLIFLMLGQAVSFGIESSFGMHSIFLIIGAILFALSDLLLAPIYFLNREDKVLIGLNYITYYGAQLMIAISIYHILY